MGTVIILEPRASEEKKSTSLSPRLSQLRGRTIAVLNNGWLSWVKLGSKLEEEIAHQFNVQFQGRWVNVHIARATPQEVLANQLRGCDAAINGFAN